MINPAELATFLGGASSVKITSFATAAGGTFASGDLSGASIVIYSHITTANPATLTTRTAALMIADSGLQANQSYLLVIANNQGTGVLTLGAGSNVTVAGTATVAINAARLFTVQVSATAATMSITITGLAISWTSAV